jgi:ribonuclease HI
MDLGLTQEQGLVFMAKDQTEASVSLWVNIQTKIHAILQCACDNIRRSYRHKRILIFSDSQAALKELSSPNVTLGLVAECLDAVSALASRNKVTLIWVPGHCGIPGNDKADKLARQEAAMPLLGPWST